MNDYFPVETVDRQMERDRRAFLTSMLRYLNAETVTNEDKNHELTATMNALRQYGILSGVTDA